METKDIVLINGGKGGVSLVDVNERIFTIATGSRLRISENSLRDIIDYAPSRDLILAGYVKIEGATRETFYDCGLTEGEITNLIGEEVKEEPQVKEKEVEEDNETSPEIVAVTYYNWLKNKKYDKIADSLDNPANVETLRSIITKKPAYDTEEIRELLSEVK